MKFFSIHLTFRQIFFLLLYYGVARHLPVSGSIFGGKISCHFRRFCCKRIFKKCGKNVNIERKASFGSGRNIEIGDNSGIGINADIPGNTIIGDNVMMGPNCYIVYSNHNFDNTDSPMNAQGTASACQTIIGNDVWIGRNVMISPGRHISDGCIIGMGCVLTKDFPAYSIIGGNPSRVIRNRKEL